MVSFLAGGIVGVTAYKVAGTFRLFCAAALLFIIAVHGIRAGRRGA